MAELTPGMIIQVRRLRPSATWSEGAPVTAVEVWVPMLVKHVYPNGSVLVHQPGSGWEMILEGEWKR